MCEIVQISRMETIWTIQLPDALTPITNQFILLIDKNFSLLTDSNDYNLLIGGQNSPGYVVVWTELINSQ